MFFKREIFELPIFSDSASNDFAKDLKIEIKFSALHVKNSTINQFLGVLPDEFYDVLKNTTAYISKPEGNDDPNFFNVQFVYPEMDDECKRIMIMLFFNPLNFSWMMNSDLNGYPSVPVVLRADKLYPKFVPSMLCTNSFLPGKVEFRVNYK